MEEGSAKSNGRGYARDTTANRDVVGLSSNHNTTKSAPADNTILVTFEVTTPALLSLKTRIESAKAFNLPHEHRFRAKKAT